MITQTKKVMNIFNNFLTCKEQTGPQLLLTYLYHYSMLKPHLLFPQLPLRNTKKTYLHTGKFPFFHSSQAQTLHI